MNLREFVSQTLVQIVQGVTDANRTFAEEKLGAAAHALGRGEFYQGGGSVSPSSDTQVIAFDVAMVAETENATSGKAGGGLKVMSVELMSASGEISQVSTSAVTSRVAFKLDLRMTQTVLEKRVGQKAG